MEDGIYENLSGIDYAKAKPYVSMSRTKEAIKSISHFYVKKDFSRKEHFDVGNGFELLLTEPHKAPSGIFTYDETQRPKPDKDFRTKENNDWKKAQIIIGEQQNMIILSAEQKLICETLVKKCWASEEIAGYLARPGVIFQLSSLWTDPVTGVKCKTRPDIGVPIQDGSWLVIELKTTKDGSPNGFFWEAKNNGYYTQAVTTIDGLEANGMVISGYLFLAAETSEPYNVQLYSVEIDRLDPYREQYQNALWRIKRSQEDEKFKTAGYSSLYKQQSCIIPLKTPPIYGVS